MKTDDINKIIAEVEKRWRKRTPATRIDEVLASYRVSRGEIRQWCNQNNIELDELDDMFQVAMTKMFINLRKEFPEEKWSEWSARDKDLAKQYGYRLK